MSGATRVRTQNNATDNAGLWGRLASPRISGWAPTAQSPCPRSFGSLRELQDFGLDRHWSLRLALFQRYFNGVGNLIRQPLSETETAW